LYYRGGARDTPRRVAFDVSRFIFTHFASVFLKLFWFWDVRR
jgi:hypothetical protein